MASWLVTPDRAVRVRELAGDIALCSWARHLIHTVPLSTQVYKWVSTNLMGVPCDGLASHPGGVEIFLVASCYRNRVKLRPAEPHGSYADFTFISITNVKLKKGDQEQGVRFVS